MSKKEKFNLSEKIKKTINLGSNDGKNKTKRERLTVGNNAAAYGTNKSGTIDKIKSFFSFGGGNSGMMIETTADAREWKDEWPKHMNNYHDVYEKVSIVRKCINLISDFTVAIGFEINTDNEELEQKIEEMYKETNFSEVLKTAIKKREIWGNAAFHIIKDDEGNIVDFVPLDNQRLRVEIDPETMRIDHFKYTTYKQGQIKLNNDDVFYVTKDALDTRLKGVSALESIKTTIKRKWNLEKDLEQAAKRLWAPYNIFKYDTSYIKDEEQQRKEIREFINKIGPGKTIVHNQNVEPNLIDMTPDINALNSAIRSADEEIIGNWGIPKALLSRERTEDMSTLEFSIQTLYEGPISSTQQYFKNEIEKQIYNQIAENIGVDYNECEHIWRANKFHDSPTIRALTYAVKEGVISPKSMIEMLGWSSKSLKSDIDDKAEPKERKPPDERPVTMSQIKRIIRNRGDQELINDLQDEGFFEEVN